MHLRNVRPQVTILFAGLLSAALFSACQQSQTDINMPPAQQSSMVVPVDFPQPLVPADNPINAAKIDLGRRLFYEVRLSRDNAHACASCHQPSASFSDFQKPLSFGIFNERGSRNAPALINIAYDTSLFWDGRATTLEQQATAPILNPLELGSDSETVVANIASDGLYKKMFANAFGNGTITMTRIAQAIATFERTFISGSSAYDQFNRGDSSALSDGAQRGLTLFLSKEVNCVGCHKGFNFTDNNYHSTGLDFEYADIGREDVTSRQSDNGKFRTPTLRNIALTSPYMHDGRFTTLEQVLAHYNQGGLHNSTQDSLVRPLHLTDQQIGDIIAFLNSLTDKDFTTRKDFTNPNP
jgi:cytochrome c peroxidase